MSVIIPNARISARWNGALQARLRHAPLEAFMRSRGLKWSVSGETRTTDNLAGATIHLVNRALDEFPGGRAAALCPPRHAAVGQIACAVSSSLAVLIQEPAYWRTAALVATARILEKSIGLSAAAHLAAASAREYSTVVGNGAQEFDVLALGHATREAVARNDAAGEAAALQLVARRLESIGERPPAPAERADEPVVYRIDGVSYQV